jgi:hypothetical protein
MSTKSVGQAVPRPQPHPRARRERIARAVRREIRQRLRADVAAWEAWLGRYVARGVRP